MTETSGDRNNGGGRDGKDEVWSGGSDKNDALSDHGGGWDLNGKQAPGHVTGASHGVRVTEEFHWMMETKTSGRTQLQDLRTAVRLATDS